MIWAVLGFLAFLGYSEAEGSGPVAGGRAPVPGARLSSPFGWRLHPTLRVPKLHTGIDLAAPRGTPIYAAEGGTVERIDVDGSGKGEVNGNTVHIKGPSGTWSYLHMQTAPFVRIGQRVEAGTQLGIVGTTGRSSGPHLHLQLARMGMPIDPWPLVAPLYGDTIGEAEECDHDVCFGEVA